MTKIKTFFSGSDVGFLDTKQPVGIMTNTYMPVLWRYIKPSGEVINMGIGSGTPDSVISILDWPVQVRHFELDNPRSVVINPKESVVWNADILEELHKRESRSVNGVIIWHGPEHLDKDRGVEAIVEASRVASRFVVLGCPWDRLKGWRKMKPGKDHLGHKSVWTETDFMGLGFRVAGFDKPQLYPGCLFAWKVNT